MNILLIGEWNESNRELAAAFKEAGHTITLKPAFPGNAISRYYPLIQRLSPGYAAMLDDFIVYEMERQLLPFDSVIVNDARVDVAKLPLLESTPVVDWDESTDLNLITQGLTRDAISAFDKRERMELPPLIIDPPFGKQTT